MFVAAKLTDKLSHAAGFDEDQMDSEQNEQDDQLSGEDDQEQDQVYVTHPQLQSSCMRVLQPLCRVMTPC